MVPYCSCCLCLYFGSSIMLVTYFVNFRLLNDHLFGKELFILFAASAFRKLSSIYVFSYFPFGFEGRIWDLIVSVPDHSLYFYFGSAIMLVTYFVNFRLLNDHLFGKELFILFAASAFRKLSSIYVFSYFPFGFEGGIRDLIVSVPDHCLSFYFRQLTESCWLGIIPICSGFKSLLSDNLESVLRHEGDWWGHQSQRQMGPCLAHTFSCSGHYSTWQ